MGLRGAEFRKTDLQIHSPRDCGWEGARPEAQCGHNPSAESLRQAREQFCKEFIAKCLEQDLRAIGITDHHEGVYAYLAIETKQKLESEQGPLDLWIFPGMELTCKDSCQALILFDADLEKDLFQKARSILKLPTNCNEENLQGIQVELLDHNLEELQPLLQSDEELRDRFIILPHVKPRGHKTVLRQGFHKRFKDMPYVGGYMDRCYPHELQDGDRRILEGEIPAWGCEKRGVISTSDSRFADFRHLGNYASWIKLASPKAESLRQAFLAPDSRIQHTEPKLPDVVIKRVEIQGTNYLEAFSSELNPQMNTIIGGRGAGKSSLLEYIRFALGCSAIDEDEANNNEVRASQRMRDLLTSTLSLEEGKVTLEILLNGAPITVSRTIANSDIIEVFNDGTSHSNTPEHIRKLIPVQPFRQGELSDLARDELARRLLKLVTANASDKLSDIEADLKGNGQRLSETLAKSVRLTAAKQKKTQNTTEISLLQSQITSIQEQLTPETVSQVTAISEHGKFLNEKDNIATIKSLISQTNQGISQAISSLKESLLNSTKEHPVLEIDELHTFYNLVKKLVAPSEQTVDENSSLDTISAGAQKFFSGVLSQISDLEARFDTSFEEHEKSYQDEKARLQGQKDLIERIEDFKARQKRVQEELEKAEDDIKEFKDADQELQNLRESHLRLQEELVNVIKEQTASIEVQSSGLARAELSDSWDFRELEDAIETVLKKIPMIREKRIEEVIAIFKEDDNPLIKWKEIVDELLVILKWKARVSTPESQQAPDTPLLRSALDDGFLEKLYITISSDLVALTLRAILRPKVDIFQIRDGSEIEFRRASQGEQAATLLNILMSQSRGPLIIDQPEEDLDNKIINDIIRTIRKTKGDRQLILSTHNANIAVNGDSELVIEMALGRKNACGAIDEIEVSSAITSTMEGGRDAFELRRKKYNF